MHITAKWVFNRVVQCVGVCAGVEVPALLQPLLLYVHREGLSAARTAVSSALLSVALVERLLIRISQDVGPLSKDRQGEDWEEEAEVRSRLREWLAAVGLCLRFFCRRRRAAHPRVREAARKAEALVVAFCERWALSSSGFWTIATDAPEAADAKTVPACVEREDGRKAVRALLSSVLRAGRQNASEDGFGETEVATEVERLLSQKDGASSRCERCLKGPRGEAASQNRICVSSARVALSPDKLQTRSSMFETHSEEDKPLQRLPRRKRLRQS